MTTKICITEVDLGLTVDEIIRRDVAVLTANSRKELDTALALAKTVKDVKDNRTKTKTDAEQKLNDAMKAAYNKLVEAGQDGVPTDEIMKIVADVVPNASAFTIRMKSILSQDGNKYIIERIKRLSIPHYVFTPYNITSK